MLYVQDWRLDLTAPQKREYKTIMRSRMYTIVCLSIFLLTVSHAPSIAETLFSEDFSQGADRWEVGVGTWQVENGEYTQTDATQFTSSFLKAEFWDPAWTEYTLELKAKKLGGNEGFCIVYGIMQDHAPANSGQRQNIFDWVIGGWSNTKSAMRKWLDGSWTQFDESQHIVDSDDWYKIKVEVSPAKVVCYLNDEKTIESDEGPEGGRIGFILFNTSAAFDDIVVYDAGGPAQVYPNQKLAACWGQIKFER
jgi:alpha-L-arabinofuranosidase